MATQNLIRWSGVALLLGGVSSALSALFHPNNNALNAVFDRVWAPTHVGEGLAFLLIALGLVGLHLRQAEKAGRLGLIGFILAVFGSAAMVNEAMLYEAYILPYIAAQQAATKSALDLIDPAGPLAGALLVSMAGLVVFTLGIILTSIATMRAGVLPRWPGWLLIAGLAVRRRLARPGFMVHPQHQRAGIRAGVSLAGLCALVREGKESYAAQPCDVGNGEWFLSWVRI